MHHSYLDQNNNKYFPYEQPKGLFIRKAFIRKRFQWFAPVPNTFCSTNQRTPHIIQKHQADNNHQCTDHRKATSLLQHTTTHISFSSLFYASQR